MLTRRCMYMAKQNSSGQDLYVSDRVGEKILFLVLKYLTIETLNRSFPESPTKISDIRIRMLQFFYYHQYLDKMVS